MRTTLDLDEDLIALAKALARQSGSTGGRVVSDLARKALQPADAPEMRNGVPLFAVKAGAKRADNALVNRLRDGE